MKTYIILIDSLEHDPFAHIYKNVTYDSRDKAIAKLEELVKQVGGLLYNDKTGAYDRDSQLWYDVIELNSEE